MLIPQTWTLLIVIFRAVFGLFAVLLGFLDYDAGLSHRLEHQNAPVVPPALPRFPQRAQVHDPRIF